MTDILIRGMDMPKTCDECPMYTCMHSRHDCPLVELPEHGDLIDRFKLLHPDGNPFNGPMAVTACTIIEQPTVIPSNKEIPE